MWSASNPTGASYGTLRTIQPRTHIGGQLARFEIVLKSKSGPPPSLLTCDLDQARSWPRAGIILVTAEPL
jgi:hypothetical protein